MTRQVLRVVGQFPRGYRVGGFASFNERSQSPGDLPTGTRLVHEQENRTSAPLVPGGRRFGTSLFKSPPASVAHPVGLKVTAAPVERPGALGLELQNRDEQLDVQKVRQR